MTASRLRSSAPERKTGSLPPLKIVPRFGVFALFLTCFCPVFGQVPSPAHWTLTPAQQRVAPGGEALLELRLDLDAGWHMYSVTTPKPGPTGGPTQTTIQLADSPAVASQQLYFAAPERTYDPNFQIETETYERSIKFYLKAALSGQAPSGPLELTAQMRYQLCNDKQCLPPKKVTAAATVTVDPAAAKTAAQVPAGWTLFQKDAAPPAALAGTVPQKSNAPQNQGLGAFLLLAFGFGLAAIFTPCVFPMIPITMSFFLNQGSPTRGQAIRQAVVFCLGIVLLFTGIGFGLTAALGPFAVVQLGSSPWVNGLITLVFLAFGLSLLGAFEITLPSSLLTRLNSESNRGGYAGTLIMGLTFCLASFACVGPFMGTLLAASVGSDKLQPVLGMLAFSLALSSPFFLLAMFPSFLGRLPRSGGWMARVKVVLGFAVLAAMLKYLATVDQVLHWNLLTRERFLAVWIVLFACPGLYLLGFLRMEGIKRDENVGAGRALLGVLFLGFALSLIPGMFGGRLGELDAYVPAAAETSALPSGGAAQVHRAIKNDYEAAFRQAKAENKRVLVEFTGYACTNCKWMKANMFPRPEIAGLLDRFILLDLYTDGSDADSEKNQKRQESLFQTVAIPYYAILDADEKPVASFPGLTKDPNEFAAFLKKGAAQ
ncbi:MAG: cytochrome c biogenesis protein CcdA [Bryobacteraceae bacterium]|nr:cytochrome c biogenesis protein CcdA [Bryobacteraceae bacterium]